MLNTSSLSLDQAPPIWVPLRFFLTAPAFGILAGALMLVQGEGILVSRWSPVTIALVHLLTLGFITQIMCGALLQILPVLAGIRVPAVGVVATLTHGGLTLGGGLLVAGILWHQSPLMLSGATLACLGLGILVLAIGIGLVRQRHTRALTPVVMAIRLALVALVVTLGLGVMLVMARSGWLLPGPAWAWLYAHPLWGLVGWIGLLLVGVGMELVPMFYLTPHFPAPMRTFLVPVAFLVLTLGTLAAWMGGWESGLSVATGVAGLGLGLFALGVLWRLWQRRRQLYDATLMFWWSGIAAMVLGYGAWLLGWGELFIGVMLLIGVGLGLTTGMLYKIVPFLAWFHLQHRQVALGRFNLRLPTMKGFIPETAARRQLAAHLAALCLPALSPWWPGVAAYLGGTAMLIASLLLALNLLGAYRLYHQVLASLEG